jgi:sec-independent protein translocase protein TatA
MFGLGTGELVIILLVLVVLFGATKLPQLGEGLGKALRGFKGAVQGDDAPEKRGGEAPRPPPAADRTGRS